MHTQVVNLCDSTGETVFSFNGDYSGDVVIRRGPHEIEVPARHLAAFVAQWVRDAKARQLEEWTDGEVLGLGFLSPSAAGRGRVRGT